jgi:SSS family solute:Na+ symporter
LFLINVVLGWTHFHFLYAAPILTLIDTGILLAVSLSKPTVLDASSAANMWRLSFSREEGQRLRGVPPWQDYRFQAAALLLLTASVVIIFR